MEELTENAEEGDEGESKQSEQKLGKLNFKVRVPNFMHSFRCDDYSTNQSNIYVLMRLINIWAVYFWPFPIKHLFNLFKMN